MMMMSREVIGTAATDEHRLHRYEKYETEHSVVLICVYLCKSVAAHFFSFKITMAAFLPLAPMMPPPGCVADPHM